ncbi:MAG: dihydropteroate synthase [Pseudomonadales bacterium]
MKLRCANRELDLSSPVVMGILNITPDSFSDGGVFFSQNHSQLDHCLRAAAKMLADGARVLDIGGESTRPNAQPVSSQAEMDRVLPVVVAIAARLDVVISVDTSNPHLMREAAARGAGMLNDVRALRREGALQAAVQTGLPVCLMHMQGEPENMQENPHYDDVVVDVRDWLQARVAQVVQAGIAPENIVLDPGFGFGKTLEHNVDLLRQLNVLAQEPCPMLVGLSRKSLAGKLSGKPVQERLSASLALAQIALDRGARILRVHDVAETVDMVSVWRAIHEKN